MAGRLWGNCRPVKLDARTTLGLCAAALLCSASTNAWANSATPPLFGKEILKLFAWVLLPLGLVGLVLGLALAALCFMPKFLEALDSSLLVFSRGVIAVIAISTLSGSAFCLTTAGMVLIESRVLGSLAAVSCFTVLPSATALLFTAELVYAATLYTRVHRARRDGLSRALSVASVVLAVPCGLVALLFGFAGIAMFLDTLRLAQGAETLSWGLGGVLASALLGLGGFFLALSGAIRSTAAVLGRGAVMLLSVAIFFCSAVLVGMGFSELSTAPGMPPASDANVFVVFALLAFVLLLLATEFAVGAVLHYRVARAEGSALGKWLGGASVAIASLFSVGALAAFGLGLIAGLTS